jgi:hypothetical protein
MYDVISLPYRDREGKGYASEITDDSTGQQWRTTGPTLRDALLGAKRVIDTIPKDNVQRVADGADLVIPL